MKKIIVILCFLISVGIVSAAISDYLSTSESDISQSGSVRIGQPVSATMTLVQVGMVPDKAILGVATDLDRPSSDVTIDGETEPHPHGLNVFNITLDAGGVEEIEIVINGFAPSVAKQEDIKVLDVKTYIEHKGETDVQSDGTITLTVSDKEIRETVSTIEDTQEKLAVAEAKVETLKSSGVNTAELEAEIQNAKELLDNAETLHEREEIDLARSTAESASKILDGVILDAEKMGAGPSPLDIKRYLVIAGAVIAVLILALLIKSKREELG